ncbi:hypothetical protein [uncultured Novosphingobium sp.]|uniref:hypothetical protein n=1 Tax=uncultured Novosphingobium sp. TaxID=292277 RepID=UPI0025987DBC|nr:hypothetical protein [uncultured Novosphingobium sp.]
MASFDPSILEVVIDDRGRCWVTDPGPSMTIWQLVEIDRDGRRIEECSCERMPAFEPIWRLGSRQWMLSVQYRSDASSHRHSLGDLTAVASQGIHALVGARPEQVSVPAIAS